MALILIVDDEPLLRRSLRRTLERVGHSVEEAGDVAEAGRVLNADEVDLVLCDINMPGDSGLDLVRALAAGRSDTAVIMLTGIDDPAVADEALQTGAYGYLVKPVERNEVLINVTSGLRRRELELRQRSYVQELESKITSRGTALRDALERLEHSEAIARGAEREIVARLVAALTLRSEETGAHIRRVGEYSALLARAVTVDIDAEVLRLAAMLHDIGKIGIPDPILLKPGRLSDSEFEIIKRHPKMGNAMLANGRSPVLTLGAEIALTHHERWDGHGYPSGLRGDEIPLAGRIVAIADVFDALTSDRVYRQAMPLATALGNMALESGSHFDPGLLDLFLEGRDAVAAIEAAHPERDGDRDLPQLAALPDTDVYVPVHSPSSDDEGVSEPR
jgi:putative two-component system response regulator